MRDNLSIAEVGPTLQVCPEYLLGFFEDGARGGTSAFATPQKIPTAMEDLASRPLKEPE
jgi:hypothetical protein